MGGDRDLCDNLIGYFKHSKLRLWRVTFGSLRSPSSYTAPPTINEIVEDYDD